MKLILKTKGEDWYNTGNGIEWDMTSLDPTRDKLTIFPSFATETPKGNFGRVCQLNKLSQFWGLVRVTFIPTFGKQFATFLYSLNDLS